MKEVYFPHRDELVLEIAPRRRKYRISHKTHTWWLDQEDRICTVVIEKYSEELSWFATSIKERSSVEKGFEKRESILDRVKTLIRSNPLPPQSSVFTREQLHERR